MFARRSRLLALATVAVIALSAPLSGCIVADNGAGELTDANRSAIDDALDEASHALDAASDDVSTALSDLADSLSNLQKGISGSIGDALSDAQHVAGDLFTGGAVLDSTVRVDVQDAQSGDTLTSYDTDALDTVRAALSSLSPDAWGLAGEAPDGDTAEYTLCFQQKETQKLGQDASEVGTWEVLRLTTYRDSRAVTLAVGGDILSWNMELPAADLDTLRNLAS